MCVAHFSALISISFVTSFLEGPLGRFPPVAPSLACSLSRPSAPSTSLERSRQNPCASAHWSGMPGCLGNQTPNTPPSPHTTHHTPQHQHQHQQRANDVRETSHVAIFTGETVAPSAWPTTRRTSCPCEHW